MPMEKSIFPACVKAACLPERECVRVREMFSEMMSSFRKVRDKAGNCSILLVLASTSWKLHKKETTANVEFV